MLFLLLGNIMYHNNNPIKMIVLYCQKDKKAPLFGQPPSFLAISIKTIN